jgi:uncharacterized protein YqhQ
MSDVHVGGQAVIEGVMMRAPESMAIAIRKQDGSILVTEEAWRMILPGSSWLKKPLLRGSIILFESLMNGIKALSFSANEVLDDADEGKISTAEMLFTIIIAFVLAIGMFVVLPHFLTALLSRALSLDIGVDTLMFHIVDGVIKVVIFLAYIFFISLIKDIKRLFQYHGAEHKAIKVFEAGEKLTVVNARKYTTLHPRCGTSFLIVVILVSIFVFAAIFPLMPRFENLPRPAVHLIYIFIKIPLLFPIAGISYEIIKLGAKYPHNLFLKIIIAPGLFVQWMTTKKPSDDQLEVALAALEKVLKSNYKAQKEAAG